MNKKRCKKSRYLDITDYISQTSQVKIIQSDELLVVQGRQKTLK